MTTLRKKKRAPKAKKGFVHIYLDIYDASVIVSINQTDQEFKKSYIKAKGQEDDILLDMYVQQTSQESERHLGRTLFSAGTATIRIYSDLSTSQRMGTLVHELFHATDMILDDKGLQLVVGSDEAYSYLIGYLMEKTMDCYKWHLT